MAIIEDRGSIGPTDIVSMRRCFYIVFCSRPFVFVYQREEVLFILGDRSFEVQ